MVDRAGLARTNEINRKARLTDSLAPRKYAGDKTSMANLSGAPPGQKKAPALAATDARAYLTIGADRLAHVTAGMAVTQ